MPAWLIVVLSIVTILALDATIGRWALGRFTRTFARNPITGGSPANWGVHKTRHLLVYLPGTLADGVDSIAEIEGTLAKPFSRVLRVSYGFWRFVPKNVIDDTARHIGLRGSYYDKVTILGSSMGGLLAMHLIAELRTEYDWHPSNLQLIAVDTPTDVKHFAEPGRTTSRILRWVYAGPLVSLIVDPILSRVTVPPKDENIEAGLDGPYVKRTAKARMAKFHFAAVCDQQRFLCKPMVGWRALRNVRVVYLACMRNNETVLQPNAEMAFEESAKPFVTYFCEVPVESTHCGYLERPGTWKVAFTRAFEVLSLTTSS